MNEFIYLLIKIKIINSCINLLIELLPTNKFNFQYTPYINTYSILIKSLYS
jgi:hypothetical protein